MPRVDVWQKDDVFYLFSDPQTAAAPALDQLRSQRQGLHAGDRPAPPHDLRAHLPGDRLRRRAVHHRRHRRRPHRRLRRGAARRADQGRHPVRRAGGDRPLCLREVRPDPRPPDRAGRQPAARARPAGRRRPGRAGQAQGRRPDQARLLHQPRRRHQRAVAGGHGPARDARAGGGQGRSRRRPVGSPS